jgi:hypothetical protein
MAKHKVEATITLSFETEVDTDDLEEFTDEDSELDASDSDAVHDVMVDIYNDEDSLLETLNENGFSVSKVEVKVEPAKEKSK